jgi:hypothetical protein
VAQRRVKGEANVVPDGDVSGGTPFIAEMSAFEVAKMANVMDRRVLARLYQRRLSGRRQLRPLGEQWIENHGSAFVAFSPHPEVASELVAQDVSRLRISLYRQTDGCGGASIGGAFHPAAEHLAERASHNRKLASATRDVKGIEILLSRRSRG